MLPIKCQSVFTVLNRLLISLLIGFSMPVSAQSDLLEVLLEGGNTIYFRHEATDWSQQDKVRQQDDWLSCDGREMRQLSSKGQQRAAATGKAMRDLAIPVSEVLASPYCRTVETAKQFMLGKVTPTIEVINMYVADYYGGRSAVIDSARALLASLPQPGTNRIVVAHGNVARAATPVYPDEGEAVIFKPDGQGGFSVVGRVLPQEWASLKKD